MRHLTVQQISGSLDGALSGVSLELVVRHLSSCRECRERHARLTKQDDALRRLLACDFPDVLFEDMFARLGVVLEAESRGQMPPEHALPPELPPLEPERPPSREMPRPQSVPQPIPELLSETEQKRLTEAELKAAEDAALNSLEELLRDLNAKKHAAAPAAQPPKAGPVPATPVEPIAPSTPAAAPPETAQPRSLLALPPEIVASLREAAPARPSPEPAPEPVAAEPVPEPVAQEDPAFVTIEETSLTWVVVEGPLPTGPELEGALEQEPAAEAPLVVEPLGELECEPVPEGVYVIEDEPSPVAAAEPVPHAVPEPERVYVIEPEPEPHAVPEPEPEPVRAIAPQPTPEPVRATAPRPAPAPARAHPPVAAPKPPHTRPTVLEMTPETDPYADYETRLEAERLARQSVHPRRRLSRRHFVGAAAGAAVLLVALASIGYLPPVIRVPMPVLPKPHLPRIEVVQVPLSPGSRPAKSDANPAGAARKSSAQPDAQVATDPTSSPRVVPPAPQRAVVAAPRAASGHATAPVPRPAPSTHEPARTAASEPARAAGSEPPPAAVSEPGLPHAVEQAPAPVRTVPPPAPVAVKPATEEPAADDGASWPLLCGVVLDETGSPVAGARVALADLDLGARTDRRGHFCVAAPPGDRTLSVVAAGFATNRRIVSLGAQGLELSISLASAP